MVSSAKFIIKILQAFLIFSCTLYRVFLVRHVVRTAVRMGTLFWVMTLRRLEVRYCLFSSEYWDSTLFRNVSICQQVYTPLKPRTASCHTSFLDLITLITFGKHQIRTLLQAPVISALICTNLLSAMFYVTSLCTISYNDKNVNSD